MMKLARTIPQHIIDEDMGMASGTRLRLSNALKRVFDVVDNNKSGVSTQLLSSDVISFACNGSTYRTLVRHLPPLIRSFLGELCKTRIGTLHGATVSLFLPCGDFEAASFGQHMWLDNLRCNVSWFLAERHGLGVTPFADDNDYNDDHVLADVMMPGTETSVREHAHNVVTWELVVSSLLKRTVSAKDVSHLRRLSNQLVLSSFGLTEEAFMDIDGIDNTTTRAVKLAHNFVDKMHGLRFELDKLLHGPETFTHLLDETCPDMPACLKQPPRFVLLASRDTMGSMPSYVWCS
jgi:hypothetical protein